MHNVLVINGPNLNCLGIRERNIYGSKTLSDVKKILNKTAKSLNITLNHYQSNSESKIINRIHESHKKINFIIINPAAFTHTSIALRDAFLSVDISFIEVHLSNIYKREKFRHRSYLSDIALGIICGFGVYGYEFALNMAYKYLSQYQLNKKN